MKYDLFICYSHYDKAFAQHLEHSLKKYYPPFGLKVPRRRLSIFRDESEAAGNDLNTEIRAALDGAAKLVVICSRAAHQHDYWINREIEYFISKHSKEDIIPVLIDGRPNSEVERIGAVGDAAFPRQLTTAIDDPWSVDFRSTAANKGRLEKERHSWYHLLASIYDLERKEVEQRERRRRSRNLAITGAILILLATGSFYFVQQLRMKSSVEMAEKARKLYDQQSYNNVHETAGLAIAAVKKYPTSQAIDVLKMVFADIVRKQYGIYSENHSVMDIDAQGRYLAMATQYGSAIVIDLSTKQVSTLNGHLFPISFLQFSPDGKYLFTVSGLDNMLQIWETKTARLINKFSTQYTSFTYKVIFLPDSSGFIVPDKDRGISIRKWADMEHPISVENIFQKELRFHPSGKTFLLYSGFAEGTLDNMMKVVNCANGKLIAAFSQNIWPVNNFDGIDFLTFTDHGRRLIAHTTFMQKFSMSSHRTKPTIDEDSASFYLLMDFDGKGKPLNARTIIGKQFDFNLLFDGTTEYTNPENFDSEVSRALYNRYPKVLGDYGLGGLWILNKKKMGIGKLAYSETLLVIDLNKMEITNTIDSLHVNNIKFDSAEDIAYLIENLGVSAFSTGSRQIIWNIRQRFDKMYLSPDNNILYLLDNQTGRIWLYNAKSGVAVGDLYFPKGTEQQDEILYMDMSNKFVITRTAHQAFIWDINKKNITLKEELFTADKKQYEEDLKLFEDSATSPDLLKAAERRVVNGPLPNITRD